jgi:hypothetical protein
MSALRELLAVFGTEYDDKGVKQGEKSVEGFKQTILEFGKALAGTFAVGKMVDFTKEVLESADALAKQSQTLGVSASDLQGWQWAAQLSGSSAEEFTGAFTKFNRNLAEASKGTGPAAEALKVLGVSAEDLKTKLPLELLEGAADGIAAMHDPAKRTAAVMSLFGKGAAKLVPLFQEGSEGIKKLRAETEELGFSFDEAFLANAQEVNDNLDRVKKGIMGIGIQAIKQVLPQLTEWSKRSVEVIKGLVSLVKHSEAVKAALLTFGTFGAIRAISAMVSLAQKAGFLKAGLRGLLFELAPITGAFLGLEDALTFLNGGESVTGDLVNKYFGPDATARVQAFVKALKEDFGPTLSEVFAILTDGKPLDERLKELQNFISGSLAPQFKADFGDMADSMLAIVSVAGDIAVAIDKIVKAIKWVISAVEWVGQHAIVNPIGSLLFGSQDAAANDAARSDAVLRDSPNKRATAGDYDQPWYLKAIGALAGIDSTQVANAANGGLMQKIGVAAKALSASDLAATSYLQQAPSFASAPLLSAPASTEITQSANTTINQYITANTPAELKTAAGDGAKSGVSKGIDLLATKAAVVQGGR